MQASADFPKYALYSFNSVPHVQIYLPVTFIQQYSIGNLSCIIQPKFVPNILNFFYTDVYEKSVPITIK